MPINQKLIYFLGLVGVLVAIVILVMALTSTVDKGWTINKCLASLDRNSPACATQTATAGQTATAKASIPAWWPFGH